MVNHRGRPLDFGIVAHHPGVPGAKLTGNFIIDAESARNDEPVHVSPLHGLNHVLIRGGEVPVAR
jgi:hypothetical protein